MVNRALTLAPPADGGNAARPKQAGALPRKCLVCLP